ncbi:MAG TPA: glycosyltransferase family 39 protein [Pyrinomonadaceae bacterium]|nr:glycosyltransferase family 39 protein [Pyrinomonadaceae bacterium]
MKITNTNRDGGNTSEDVSQSKKRRRLILISLVIFTIASGVRLLSWQDARIVEARRVQSSVAADYKRVAHLLKEGGLSGFFSSSSPLSNPDNLGHPPGYSILIAAAQKIINQSDTTVQLIQILCDAFAAVVLFLIIAELLSVSVATVAGLLSAFAPQFAWNSVLLLPDTLAVLPIMLAVYCLVLAYKRPRLGLIITAGVMAGVSCWLRANALLLPFFLAALVFFLSRPPVRLRYSMALVCGALLIIIPLTIRNAVAVGHFIPVSLGAGQTFLEGIADYDKGQRFDLPNTDLGIMYQEADAFGRPDYRDTLFGPDGIRRERLRLSRGLNMVRSRPFWFMGVMIRRAGSMLKLERTPLVSARPPVTRSLALADTVEPLWAQEPASLLTTGIVLSPQGTAVVSTDGQSLIVTGDDSARGKQFATAPVRVQKHVEYLWRLPIKLEQGRIKVGVENTQQFNWEATTIVDTLEGKSPLAQPTQNVELPFVSENDQHLRLTLANEGAPGPTVVHVGGIKLFQLGPASFVWTRYPRILIRSVQKLFITAVMLPLGLCGIALTVTKRSWRVLAILLVVPAYYLCVQSATHTEYRYILALYHFLFAFAAVTIGWVGTIAISTAASFRGKSTN